MTEGRRTMLGSLAALMLALCLGDPALAEEGEGAASPEQAVEYSEAEIVLWMTEQLAMIERPVKLTYEFTKTGSYEEGFSDIVELEIFDIKEDGMKSARVNFFTGERHQFVPERERTNVNPVLGIYMQGDVYEMGRLTDGHWRYFHRQVKYAFADAAEVRTVQVTFDGETVPAKQVLIKPYVNDPHRSEMEKFADKEYRLTVSDQVPGYLYEIYTIIPGKTTEQGPAAAPLIEERLRLVDVARLETDAY